MASEPITSAGEGDDLPIVPLGGTRAQAIQRLQVGVFGLAAILLVIGLANIILDRAKQSELSTVPEAAATVEPEDAPSAKSDPLVDAGVVPELPTDGEPSGEASSAQGDGAR